MCPAALRRCAPLFLAATLAAAPAPAQTGPSPRQIAARAQKALLVVRALGASGDTIASGTGFVVRPDGTFITNYHVVSGAHALRVETLDGRGFQEVQFVAADPVHDLAVLRIPGSGFSTLAVERDTVALLGDRVYVMGNPLGMAGTFSDGLVSGRRPVEGVTMIQISAPISPGSSGGPVMNDQGAVIGVATLMLVGGQNLNMAVPTRYVAPLLARAPGEVRAFTASMVPASVRGGLASVEAEDLGGAARGGGSNEWRDQVLRQLEATADVARRQGMEDAFPTRTGMARTGQEASLEYTLTAGVRYLFTARCDEDCADVDLGIVAPGGKLLHRDVADDDHPTLTFVAPVTGTYRVVVAIARCAVEPCAYGVGALQQR